MRTLTPLSCHFGNPAEGQSVAFLRNRQGQIQPWKVVGIVLDFLEESQCGSLHMGAQYEALRPQHGGRESVP